MKPTARTGLTRTTSSGMASSQPRIVALLTTLAEVGHGQLHEARSRLEVTGGEGVADGLS